MDQMIALKLKLDSSPVHSLSYDLLSASYAAGICALCLSIHLPSGGLSCCGVSSSGLGRLSKSSDSSDYHCPTRLSSILLHPSLKATCWLCSSEL